MKECFNYIGYIYFEYCWKYFKYINGKYKRKINVIVKKLSLVE